jgi:hypothetical protein
MQFLLNLLLIFHSYTMCSTESGVHLPMYAADYSIGESEPMRITAAVFHACPPISSQYRLYDCLSMLNTMTEQPWRNEYMATRSADGEMLCNAMRSNAIDVQNGVDQILSDSAGGALVRLRRPHTLVIFYEEEIVLNWIAGGRERHEGHQWTPSHRKRWRTSRARAATCNRKA